jgi:tRNA nucleotidyltransferase (CCA-adding enzyme)
MARPLPQPVRIYRVGGAVRDALIGRPVTDHDFVVVGATPEIMLASGFRAVGQDFPVFLHPDTSDEYALARTERKHGRGYRGFEFFASPDVTLEEDLARRDLTINAMARGDDGVLVDPFGGEADLRAGLLRHVSPAFTEDPLRVLRVARFAARFGFAVAPETEVLLREIVASGELAALTPERVWQELARGLMEVRPSRMLAVLRACGALRAVLPEVDALFGLREAPALHAGIDMGVRLAQALDWSAAHGHSLPARYGVLTHDLGIAAIPGDASPRHQGSAQRSVRLAEAMSGRLRVPIACGDAARLAARWHGVVSRAADIRPATMLDLIGAADALRRPERLATLLDVCAADACSRPGAPQTYPAADVVLDAVRVVRSVNAGAIARKVSRDKSGRRDDDIAKAVRAARLKALRAWRRATAGLR